MKGKAADLTRITARPDPALPGLLIYGQDAMRVALKRQEAVAALTGPNAEEEMRLTRIAGAELRRDPAMLSDAVQAIGFFPGSRVVLVDDASDGLAGIIGPALEAWRPGDALIVVAAGGLGKSSALRKLFEGHKTAIAVAIFDDPPGEADVARWLAEAGLHDVPRDAMRDLMLLSRALDPGDFRQTVEKIALYKHGDPAPLTSAEVALLAPQSIEAGVDELIDLVADGRVREFGTLMARVVAQGTQPVTLCIAALRHFRMLHMVVADSGGVQSGLSRLRPPVFGPRRDRMARQAQAWGMGALEEAVRGLLDTDLALRSSSRAPAMALVERALIRVAMMPRMRR